MPEHKHTPGNWVARGTLGPASNPHISGPWVIEADGKRIATLRLLGGPEQELDARLMAAAPDLLEALEGLLRQVEAYDLPLSDPERIAARAAIRKATGQA
ncbi:hypothetical protein [Azotobacter vinelandii]|uniref:hypothetical protein n=1 Tax=Azotobacter vinelandii TaxID=354 RepID=UPI0009302E63|nr:hypothetical protein [Azotobacter vinelandii]